jgi:glycosyltransferase involved in cell wall biosynthesis
LADTLRTDLTLIVPWLKRGGADLAALFLVDAARRLKRDARVVVITTENGDSPWACRLPADVEFLDLGRQYASSPDRLTSEILERLRRDWPQAIHVVQSSVGWQLLGHQGEELARQSRLYASVFLDGLSLEGTVFSYARRYLPQAVAHLTRVFSDNAAYVHTLVQDLAIPAQKFMVLRHPVRDAAVLESRAWAPSDRSRKRVLWASRIDRQKRPDIAIAIARMFPDVSFDMFGDTAFDHSYIETLFDAKPCNLTRYGPFDGFAAIDVSPYACLLYTTESDGLPNVLLEAGSTGLPIIAPAVGGIPELIDAETGFLVDAHEEIGSYAIALRQCLSNPREAYRKGVACRQRIRQRHGWGDFVRSLGACEGYAVA